MRNSMTELIKFDTYEEFVSHKRTLTKDEFLLDCKYYFNPVKGEYTVRYQGATFIDITPGAALTQALLWAEDNEVVGVAK